ncbi:MAG: hypothetical protein QOK05_2019 [Chloroflexota bacterium]|jgi:hypothetical protein|nr:hypothetical protein [Chloroflexota bacterium]
MSKLGDITKLIRSKNAGPFLITFDVLFEDTATYTRVRDSGALTAETFARMYRTPIGDVEFSTYEAGLAIKATIPRKISSGDIGDPDIYGGQLYGPLVDIEIP